MDKLKETLIDLEHKDWRKDLKRYAKRDPQPLTKPKIRREPNGRKTRKGQSLTPEQRERKRAADRRSYERNKHRIAARRKRERQYQAYLRTAVEKESTARQKVRREYYAPKIDAEYNRVKLYALERGLSYHEALQALNLPSALPYALPTDTVGKPRPPHTDCKIRPARGKRSDLMPYAVACAYTPPQSRWRHVFNVIARMNRMRLADDMRALIARVMGDRGASVAFEFRWKDTGV